MLYEIKSIGMWPFIKVSFFFNLVVGFIFGLFYALFAGFIMTIMSRFSEFQPGGFDFDLEPLPIGIMLVVLPILFAIMGAVFYTIIGVVLVLIYNLIARLVGGYELDLQLVGAGASAMPGGQPLTGYTGAPSYVPPPATGLPPQSPPSQGPPPPPQSDDPGIDQESER
jgi:hypothetical protein